MAEQPTDNPSNHEPTWLIAAWPGMGNVAVIASTFLIQALDMVPAGELPPRGRFDVRAVEVKGGVIGKPRLPRSLFYRTKQPVGGRHLIVFVGEAQPGNGVYDFAHELIDRAQSMGAERVMTFASMATQIHPTAQPRVFGASTEEDLLDELRRLEVQPLEEGQIGGLNGVILGAASDRGLPGLCMMGEIPFFAAGVPNPKAARAVLDAFALLNGIELDLDPLNRHADTIERAMLDMLRQMQGGMQQGEEGPEFPIVPEDKPGEADKPEQPVRKALDYATRQRIEGLFEEARKDRSRAMDLKQELDRLSVFDQYEDRFLDLFKRAE